MTEPVSIAVVAPAPVPPAIGGAERLWWGLVDHVNRETPHQAELLKLPSPEHDAASILDSYERFAALDVGAYDVVITGKYPAWMVDHPNHRVYLLHPLRGLYDTYHLFGLPEEVAGGHAGVDALVAHLDATRGRREALPETLARTRALLGDPSLPAGALALPSPLLRRVVHWLDDVGRAPERIARQATMSRTVRERPGYFPPGADVRIAHPMTSLAGLRPGGQRHLLCVGRLDAPKRMDLAIEAHARSATKLPLVVAGTGPDEPRLRELAGDRVRFAGRVGDAELAALYNDALAVLFTPADEDFGYIALEAMLAGTPVITTDDAGGPTEMVQDGVTGLVRPADAAALSAAIDELASHRRRARRMGEAGLAWSRHVGWNHVLDAILSP